MSSAFEYSQLREFGFFLVKCCTCRLIAGSLSLDGRGYGCLYGLPDAVTVGYVRLDTVRLGGVRISHSLPGSNSQKSSLFPSTVV